MRAKTPTSSHPLLSKPTLTLREGVVKHRQDRPWRCCHNRTSYSSSVQIRQIHTPYQSVLVEMRRKNQKEGTCFIGQRSASIVCCALRSIEIIAPKVHRWRSYRRGIRTPWLPQESYIPSVLSRRTLTRPRYTHIEIDPTLAVSVRSSGLAETCCDLPVVYSASAAVCHRYNRAVVLLRQD